MQDTRFAEDTPLQGGVLDTSEQRLVELLQSRRRDGIFKHKLMAKWDDEFPFAGYRTKFRKGKYRHHLTRG
jgi:hypothetical protein